ncbi:hypothetical protein ABDJ41_05805 [Pedobacter sp. ASV1-7]|uniref:hypothetical protein n=1 Tax=Pedobacter sp. ASV1-7 TaxID=3145237 RepID=UPI0032E8D5C3
MRLIYLRALTFSLFMFVSTLSFAQIVAWQFATPEPSTGRERTAKATTNDENIEPVLLTRGPSAIAKQGNGRGFSGNFPANANMDEAKASGAFYEFKIKAKAGHKVSLSSLNAVLRRQPESAHIYRWTYSLDGKNFKSLGTNDVTISNLHNNGAKQPTVSLSGYKDLQNVPSEVTISFRLYAWGGTSNTGSAIAFGFGKSNAAGSNVIAVDGKVIPAK